LLFDGLPALRVDQEALHALGRPVGAPYLYRADDPAKLLVSVGGYDLPRNQEGIALVGDPRNDVQLFTSQMVVAFISLHNRLVDRLRDDGIAEPDIFDEARRAAIWHYQHVILREFLLLLIGSELTNELLDSGPRLYRINDDPYIPFEFADAAYRYGHAQIRDRYQINEHFGPRPVFPDLMGFGPVAPAHTVDWTLQIDVDVDGHAPAQRAKRIDSRLPAPLIALPMQVSGSAPGTDYASLANRDLQRGQAVGLASGEAIARHLGVPVLTTEQVGLTEHAWVGETPLWFYILKEAAVMHDGDRLGPVGGRIVGEVLVGIINADPESYRSLEPNWTPTLPARRAGAFGLADILFPVD
jgi:Animal haem peroxidase